ncbi:hypothetical protein [Synechococcus sp. J7-Johnson]|uniref:hypothetical protein n=1 Tax=Synechococcus sp. J7-Johnson TaxID=2823737 RepID=UPI0020CFAF50|nr:hypothetical protein [Synechococcus sp. J7-Johnson]
MRHRCLGPALLIATLLAGPNWVWATGVSNDTRHDCRLWRNSRGLERVEIANRLGAANLLTKEHNFAVLTPGATRSLYSSSDIRRLCALL